MKFILILFYLALLWILTNIAHWLWIVPRMWLWNRKIQRNEDGIPIYDVPYTLGAHRSAILFVHGFADKPVVFKEMAMILSENFTCRCLSLYNSKSWVETVHREFEELKQTCDTVWVCGHSMGGAIALTAQLERIINADGIILLAPLFEVATHRSPFMTPQRWFCIAKKWLCLTPYLESVFPVNVKTVNKDKIAYKRDRFIHYSVYDNLFSLTDTIRNRGTEITVPIFMALAENDPVVSTSVAKRWIEKTKTRKNTVILHDCGHAIPLEPQHVPQLCKSIIEFVEVTTCAANQQSSLWQT